MDTVNRLINQTQIRWALIHYKGCSSGRTGFYWFDQTVKYEDYYDLKSIFQNHVTNTMLNTSGAVLLLLIKITIILLNYKISKILDEKLKREKMKMINVFLTNNWNKFQLKY